MYLVRSLVSYNQFIQRGSDVNGAMHREDGAEGYVIGNIKTLAPGDEEIEQDEYDREAQAIRDYNATLPEPPPEPERDPDEAPLTGAENKQVRALLRAGGA